MTFPLFVITGFTYVPGDRAYIEAADEAAAVAALVALLDDDPQRPIYQWVVTPAGRPFALVVWHD